MKRPFARIGDELGLGEKQVLANVRGYLESGEARRLGAAFDVRRLGYVSTLCAAALGADALKHIVPRLTPHPGITHCYLRTADAELSPRPGLRSDGLVLPNLWFTLCARGESFEAELQKVRRIVAPHRLLNLPAVKRFKLHVVFDPEQRQRAEQVPCVRLNGTGQASWDGTSPELSEGEKRVVRVLQGNLPPVPRLFARAAEEAHYEEGELLELLRRWQDCGVLRRVALIVRHRRLGFSANGMCVWPVPEAHLAEKGRRLAHRPEITHCYQRVAPREFPYSLYAMIHTGAWDRTRALFAEISEELELSDGLVFCSIREYKKTSHRLFVEGEAGRETR